MTLFKHIILFISVSACSTGILAQDGSTAYNFLNVTSSARVYGLGGVNITSVHDDLMTTDQNPALLGPEMHMQAGINYMRYIGGSNFAGVRFAASVVPGRQEFSISAMEPLKPLIRQERYTVIYRLRI